MQVMVLVLCKMSAVAVTQYSCNNICESSLPVRHAMYLNTTGQSPTWSRMISRQGRQPTWRKANKSGLIHSKKQES